MAGAPRAALLQPLPWGGCQGDEGGGVCKVTLRSPFPGRRARECRSQAGPSIPDLRSPALVPGHAQVPALGQPLFCCFWVFLIFPSSKFVGAGWCALPRRALPAEGARSPVSPGRPPSHSPTWMYAIFARAHSLRPGHGVATAPLPSPARRGGTTSRQDTSGRPGGPRRDWRD